MGLLSNIQSIFIDDFKAGVKQTSERPIVFIDVNALGYEEYENTGAIHPESVDRLKNMFSDQISGVEEKDLEDFDENAIRTIFSWGPAAALFEHKDQLHCVVFEPTSGLDHKHEVIPSLSNQDLDRLNKIPGWDDHWDRLVGIHEGEHCNQDMLKQRSPLKILHREVDADQATIDWFNKKGLSDITQALKDYRALGAASGMVNGRYLSADTEHATSLFIKSGPDDTALPITMLEDAIAYEDAVLNLREEISMEIAGNSGMSFEDVEYLRYDEPEKYIEAAQHVIDAGFMQRPDQHTEQLAHDYIAHLKEGKEDYSFNPRSKLTEALNGFESEINLELQLMLDMDEYEVEQLLRENPALYVETVEKALDQGLFKRPEPFTEELVRDYAEGLRRRVVDQESDNKLQHDPHNHGRVSDEKNFTAANGAAQVALKNSGEATTPIVDLHAPGGASMKIDGLDASSYFANHADPDLAGERIAMQQEALERDLSNPTHQAPSGTEIAPA